MSDRDEKRKLREARKEDADMERAQEQARAPVRKQLQRRIEDIPVYTILEDADDRAFYKLLMQRRARIFEVASITILGVPVTPPELPSPAGVTEERFTFHAVKLVGRILFRETDMYFVAFNPSGDPTSTWFTFDDAPIPSFLNQVALPYDGRYGDLYNSSNVTVKTNERVRVLSCTAVMFSETMRLGDVQQFAMRLLHLGQRRCIPRLLDKKIHSWGVYGAYGIRHLSGDHILHAVDKNIVPGLYNPKKENFEIWGLIGRRRCSEDEDFRMKRRAGVILVFLFHKDYVPRYIIMKEKGYLAPEEMKKSMCKFEKVSRTAAPSENAQMVHSSEKRREDEKIRNGDIQMLRSDLNTLRGQAWLNDAVIEFMFSIFQDLMDDTVLLVPPSLSRLLGKPEIAPNIYNDLQISLRSLVLLAINDMQESDGGDVGLHWSLLAVDMTKAEVPRFIHLDCLNGFNSQVAKNLASKVRLNVAGAARAQFLDAPMPKQPNTFNCGVYTLAAAEAICEWYLASHDGLPPTSDWIDFVVENRKDHQTVQAKREKYIKMAESYDNHKNI